MNHARQALMDAANDVGCRATADVPALLRCLGGRALRLLALHARIQVRRSGMHARLSRWASRFEPWKLAEHLLETALLPTGAQGTVTVYVSSVDGSDADNGSTWALAKATVAGGLAVATDATFNFVYTDAAHAASTGAAITWDIATSGSTVAIISVNRNGSTTTGHSGWLAGASENTGANAFGFMVASGAIAKSSVWHIYGITMAVNSGSSSANTMSIALTTGAFRVEANLVNCTITTPGSSTNARLNLGPTNAAASRRQIVRLTNCVFNSKNAATTSAALLNNVEVEWVGTTHAYSGATKSPTLFGFAGPCSTQLKIIDSDLSGFDTTAGAYFDVAGLTNGFVSLVNVKLHGTPTLTTGTWANNGVYIACINADSGDTHNVFEFRNRLGTLTENALIYANTGAQFDAAGISWEVVTTSVCSEQEPFILPWLHRWTTATGSQAVGIELLRNSATDYTDKEVWGEFEVLESATFPNGSLTSTRNAQPFDGTPADLTNSSEVWTESLTNDNEMQVQVTRTAAEKSLIRGRLIVGVASTTLYVDPGLRIGSQAANPPTRWTLEGSFCAEPAGGGAVGGFVFGG